MSRGFRSLVAVVEAGFEPVGVVMGAVAIRTVQARGCRQYGSRNGSHPMVLHDYEGTLRQAWSATVNRLRTDATRVGAHGVIGVSTRRHVNVTTGVQQIQLVGTAVRVRGASPLDLPFLSMLSMAETAKLLARGWVPSGIAVGISAVHVHAFGTSPILSGITFENAEMPGPTAGMALARNRAEHELRRALTSSRSEGAVASELKITRSSQPCTSNSPGLLIEGRILGTGIVRYRDPVIPISAVRDLTAPASR